MQIVVLDGTDVPHPEDTAMLQSLYSRSPRSVLEHLKKVEEVGSGHFMETYLVGYGHKSIGDCGTISIFVEGVSMFVAKAVQDNPLYNGQESSTRYLDMTSLGCVNPAGTEQGSEVQDRWMILYSQVLERLMDEFKARFPRQDGQKKSVWRKAVRARAFDVARGFLPAGCRTFVAWHTNLRQAADHLKRMRHNPLAEVREVAEAIESTLKERYPSTFGHKRYDDQEEYLAASEAAFAFCDREFEPFRWRSMLDRERMKEFQHLLETRPPKTELHQRFRQYGSIEFRFPLDFGSYRDLQRHRSCVQEMPLLTVKHGIHPWYLKQLPEDLREEVNQVVRLQKKTIEIMDLPPEDKQCYVAMGFLCAVRITCPLPSAVYIAELRSGTTVHPTVRGVAQEMGDFLEKFIPGLVMHHDKSDGVWDIKRGEQDIVQKS